MRFKLLFAVRIVIIRNACFLYKQKINEETLLQKGICPQSYMAGAVDYKYAECRCLKFCEMKGISLSWFIQRPEAPSKES